MIIGQSRKFGGGGGTTASNYIARCATARGSALDSTHIAAFTTYLNGLDADGLTSAFDVLVWLGTQDSTSALLNMISSNYNATANGSPTFTADRGFTGVDGSSTVYIDTNFDASTATSPLYTQNSAHFSGFGTTDVGAVGRPMMGRVTSTLECTIYPRFSDGNAYFRINNSATLGGAAVANSAGHYIAQRSSGSVQGSKNGTTILGPTASTSGPVPPGNFYVLGYHVIGAASGSGQPTLMYSIGRFLNSTEESNFVARTRTCATALGVP